MKNNVDYEFLPYGSQKIWDIINNECDGSIPQFISKVGDKYKQKVYRLFSPDKRNNKYPKPSSDLIKSVSDVFNINIEDFITPTEKNATVTNISISKNEINGNDNIFNRDGRVSVSRENNEYLEIIRKQQEQIDKLILLIQSKNDQGI